MATAASAKVGDLGETEEQMLRQVAGRNGDKPVFVISPFRKAREAARETARCGFMEVYVKADVETCAARDPKGLYKKALAGEIPQL